MGRPQIPQTETDIRTLLDLDTHAAKHPFNQLDANANTIILDGVNYTFSAIAAALTNLDNEELSALLSYKGEISCDDNINSLGGGLRRLDIKKTLLISDISAETRAKIEKITQPDSIDAIDSRQVNVVATLIERIIELIDDKKLFTDKRLTNVRNPLLHERVGKTTAIHFEVKKLLADLVLDLVTNPEENPDYNELQKNADSARQILLENTENRVVLLNRILALRTMLLVVIGKSPTKRDLAKEMVNTILKTRLDLPRSAQELILYQAASFESSNPNPAAIIKDISRYEEELSGEHANDPKFINKIKAEADFVREYYRKKSPTD